MDSLLAERKQKVECDLRQIEVEVWEELSGMQQRLVKAERIKVEQLVEATSRVSSAIFEEAENFRRNITLAAAEQDSCHVRKDLVNRSQQTDLEPDLVEGVEIRGGEVELLREDIEGLEGIAKLQEEQRRLAKEPQEGQIFIKLRKAHKIEKEAILVLDKKLRELEQKALHFAHSVAKNYDDFTPVELLAEDYSWTEAPWDEENCDPAAISKSNRVYPTCESQWQWKPQAQTRRLNQDSSTPQQPVAHKPRAQNPFVQQPRRAQQDYEQQPRAQQLAAQQHRAQTQSVQPHKIQQPAFQRFAGTQPVHLRTRSVRSEKSPDEMHATPQYAPLSVQLLQGAAPPASQARFVPKRAILSKRL